MTIADGTRKYVWGQGLGYAVSGSSIEQYHADRLGSIRALTDGTGAVTATYRTDAWGISTAQTGSSTQPFGFTGEPRDATGLSYLRARYYDPTLGRFLSRDDFDGRPRHPGSLNRYIYALANPCTMVDPAGRSASRVVGENGGSCSVGAWGGALLIASGGEIAVAASEGGLLAAGAGTVAIVSGVGLVVIGAVAIGAGVVLIYKTCVE